MKTIIYILTGLFFTLFLVNCQDPGNAKNSLRGVIYKDISEVPQFKNYKVIGGELLPKYKSFDNEYFIMHISDGIKQILIFEDVTAKDPVDLVPKHQILDTINIDS